MKINFYKGFRGMLKASAFATVMFVMQACYGAPQNARYGEPVEIHYSGTVTNEAGEPIQGITMEVNGYDEIAVTDENGAFDIMFYDDRFQGAMLTFSDENNVYASIDTTMESNYNDDLNIKMSAI